MRGQFQRLAFLTVIALNSIAAFAACEDQLSFTLASMVSVERPEATEDKDRVRIMPVGSTADDLEVISSTGDETVEIRKRHAPVVKWNVRPGNASLLFEAHHQVYVVWVRTVGQLPEIAISRIDNPLEPVFHFPLSSADESLMSGKLTLTPGEKDLLSLQTEKNIYVVAIDQLGGRVEQGRVE